MNQIYADSNDIKQTKCLYCTHNQLWILYLLIYTSVRSSTRRYMVLAFTEEYFAISLALFLVAEGVQTLKKQKAQKQTA